MGASFGTSSGRALGEAGKDALYSAFIGALTSVAVSAPVEAVKSMKPKQLADAVKQETEARLETEEKAEELKLPEVGQATENAAQGRTAEELALPEVEETALQAQEAEIDPEERTSIDDDPTQHTPEEQRRISEYKKAFDSRLYDWIKRVKTALSGGDKTADRMRLVLNPVNERAVDAIKRETGIDADGYRHLIDGSTVKHIESRHGPKGEHDFTMREDADLARIQYVLDNFDDAYRLRDQKGDLVYSKQFFDKNNNPAPIMAFRKAVDSIYYAVEAIADSAAKKLYIVSAYMEKNSGSITQALNMGNNPPQLTPTAPLGPVASAKITIPQPAQGVKNELELPAVPTQDTQQAEAQEKLELPDPAKIAAGNQTAGPEGTAEGLALPEIDSGTNLKIEQRKKVFKRSSAVPVNGLTFKGKQYLVEIGNKVPGKLINDPNLSAEKLALLEMLPEVVNKANYVGSGEYSIKGERSKTV